VQNSTKKSTPDRVWTYDIGHKFLKIERAHRMRPSRLHIPKHHSRPGETPDFSYLELSPAGATRRPDIAT